MSDFTGNQNRVAENEEEAFLMGQMAQSTGDYFAMLGRDEEARGEYLAAIDAYDQVLPDCPDFANAQNNKEIVRKIVEEFQEINLQYKATFNTLNYAFDIKSDLKVVKENFYSLELYSQAKNNISTFSPTSYSLMDTLITQVHRKGNLRDVLIAMEKVDNTIKLYRNDVWRQFFLPVPFLLISSIKSRFQEAKDIARLAEAFDYDVLDIRLSLGLYIFKMISFLTALLSLFIAFKLQGTYFWLLCLIPVFGLAFWMEFWFSQKVINDTVFVPLYQRIRDALLWHIEAQEKLIESSYRLPEIIEQRMLEYMKSTTLGLLESSAIEKFKYLEFQCLIILQGILAAVALHQSNTDEQSINIRNIPELERIEHELGIRTPGREHEVIITEINEMEKILLEKKYLMTENHVIDDELVNAIHKWEFMCEVWKIDLIKGADGIADIAQEVEDIVKKLLLV